MHKWALAPLVAVLCFAALDAPRDLDEAFRNPETTIASYWHRMVERRHGDALECFLGVPVPETTGMMQLPELVELRCRDFRVTWQGRGVVDVAYDIEYRITLGDSLARFGTGDRLRFTRAGWKIERPLLDIAQRR